jgi:hypothetical protein
MSARIRLTRATFTRNTSHKTMTIKSNISGKYIVRCNRMLWKWGVHCTNGNASKQICRRKAWEDMAGMCRYANRTHPHLCFRPGECFVQRAALLSASGGESGAIRIQDGYRTVEKHCTDQYNTRFTELWSAELLTFALKVLLPVSKGMPKSCMCLSLRHKTLLYSPFPRRNKLIPNAKVTSPDKRAWDGDIDISSILFLQQATSDSHIWSTPFVNHNNFVQKSGMFHESTHFLSTTENAQKRCNSSGT